MGAAAGTVLLGTLAIVLRWHTKGRYPVPYGHYCFGQPYLNFISAHYVAFLRRAKKRHKPATSAAFT